MERINELGESILNLLIFEETFEHIIDELKPIKQNLIQDEIKSLIVLDFIKPVKDLDSLKPSGIIYNSDNLSEFSYKITAKGINYLEKFLNKIS